MFYQIDNKFGLTFSDVRRAFPNTSFVVEQAVYGFDNVIAYEPVPPPVYDPITKGVREIAPVDGKQQWEIYDLPSEDVERNRADKLNSIRAERNRKLSECDWTQLSDAPVANREAWATYRQALRDLTAQADPLNPVWPVPPEA